MMFFLQFEATPKADHPEFAELGGAFVNCWVTAESINDAESLARAHIEEQRWIVDDLEEAYPIDRSFYDDDPKHLPYFEKALTDGDVYVFHTYPIVDEEDSDHYMISARLHRVVEEQTLLMRVITGWYLAPDQLDEIVEQISPHSPMPDVGGVGRIDSIPVFPLSDYPDAVGQGESRDTAEGIAFTYVQMDVVN